MKKSELINKVRSDEGVCTLINDLYRGYDAGDMLINQILRIIKNEGMLPPGSLEVVSPTLIYYRPSCKDAYTYGETRDTDDLWEPEDD